MRSKIEKERKWLLKRVPPYIHSKRGIYEDHSYIEQFYDEDGWRYRCTQSINVDTGLGSPKYCRLKKKTIGTGVNMEVDIEDLTAEEYNNAVAKQTPNINIVRKDRYTIPYNGKKLEIDWFHDLSLTMMEIEDVEWDEVIILPDCIEKEVLMEVTGNSKFSNFNLATEEDNQ